MANDFSAATKQIIEDGKLRKKEFDEERELLKGMAEALESAGLKAEDNAEYAKKANKLKEQELKFRLKNADSPAARKEIKQEQAAEAKKNQNLLKKMAGGITGLGKSFANAAKARLKGIGGGLLKFLKATALAGLLVAALAFLESQTWKDMKTDIVAFLPKLKSFYTGTLQPFFKNVGKFLLDPTWKNFTSLFAGVENKKSLAFGLAGITALFLADDVIKGMAAGGALFVAMTGLSALFGKNGLFRRRITGLTTEARRSVDQVKPPKSRLKAVLGSAARLAKFGGIAGAAVAAIPFITTARDKEMSRADKNSTLYKLAYGAGGAAIAGAAAGAVAGSVVPGVGTLIGGLIGGILGFTLGERLGEVIADVVNTGGFFSDKTFTEAFDSVSTNLKSVGENFMAMTERVKNFGAGLGADVTALGAGLGADIGTRFDNALTNLKSVGDNFISMTGRLKDTVSGLSTSFKEFEIPSLSNILIEIGNPLTKLANALRGTINIKFLGSSVYSVGDKIADIIDGISSPNPLNLGGRTAEASGNRALDNARQAARSLGFSPAIVNASNSSVNASSLNVTNTSTSMFHPSPLLGAVIASI